MGAGDSQTEGATRSRRWFPDLIGVAWVIIAAGAVMAPALSHGWSLGPFDQVAKFGLAQHPLPPIHNAQMGDLIREIIPWTSLSWTQVHHGLLPLWNPYSALGAPLAFNWQSGAFSLPALLGYLVPLRLDFTVQVLTTLLVAGTGMYVLGRVMRLGVVGAAMAATVFELSGSFMALLGWPIAAVMSWSGWLFAFAILVLRGRHRRRYIALLAVALALAFYAGQPDTLVVLLVSLTLFVLVMLGLRARRSGAQAIGRPLVDLAAAAIAGFGLAAPLILPGAELSSGSIRGVGRHAAFPFDYLLNVVFQKFNGLSLYGSISFNSANIHGLNYVPTAVYVGVIAVVLAVVAVATDRRPTVIAFLVVAVVSACLVYSPLVTLLNKLPGLGEVRWVRSIEVLGFALAILAGVGLDALARSHGSRKVRNWMGAGFGAAAVFLLLMWLFGRGHLSSIEAPIRNRSFIWPALEVAVGFVAFGFLVLMGRRGSPRESKPHGVLGHPSRTAAVFLLVCSTGFLVALGAPWWPSNSTFLAPTATETALHKAVGNSIVGFGSTCWYPPALGIPPDLNAMFGVHEFDSYDPLTPQSLFTSWELSTGEQPRPNGVFAYIVPLSMFCPLIETTATARLYGIQYVLEPKGKNGPPGSVFVEKVGGEGLYRIPGASVATVSPLGRHRALPPTDAPAKPLAVTYPDAASWKLHTHSATPQILRLRLTDVPGWHAVDRRETPPAFPLQPGDAAGQDPGGGAHHRASLLARHLHGRIAVGLGHGDRAGGGIGLRRPVVAAGPEVDQPAVVGSASRGLIGWALRAVDPIRFLPGPVPGTGRPQ